MIAKDTKSQFIAPLLDVSQPYLYAVVLPPLVLFALGQRRAAVMYLIGAIAVMAFLSLTN